MAKKYRLIAFGYIALVIFLPPLMGWTVVPWRDGSFMDFVHRFSNLIPLRGIWEIVARGAGTWQFAQLKLYGLHLVVMVPLGLLAGLLRQNMTGRDMGRICLQGAAVFAAVYALRLFLKLGSFDVDDILMNVAGLWIGMLAFSTLKTRRRPEKA